MSYCKAEASFGRWSEHNQEFRLGWASIGCGGKGALILKLLRRDDILGIGLYVYQNKSRMQALLESHLADWHPTGLRITFCGMSSRGGEQGFALYAYIDDVAPRQIEDETVDAESVIERVRERIKMLVRRLKGAVDFEGAWTSFD